MVKVEIVLFTDSGGFLPGEGLENYRRDIQLCTSPAVGSFIVVDDHDPEKRIDMIVESVTQFAGEDSVQARCIFLHQNNRSVVERYFSILKSNPEWVLEE
jgi:hypothetical protein